jgi:ABC-type nickel/cobalt efflux system permease component RcnA
MSLLVRLSFGAMCLLFAALVVDRAQAHPLGNFTVNHYSRIELAGDVVRVHYVLDYAEIPSVQEARAADTDGDGKISATEWEAYKDRKVAEVQRYLDLTVDGQTVQLQPSESSVTQPPGQGDIPLVRVEMWFKAAAPRIAPNVSHQATFRDRGDPARVGWREIVVHAGRGATLADSSVPAQDVTDELRSYPDDMLQNPLDRREAHWSFTMDGSTSPAAGTATSAAPTRPSDPLAALVTASELNPAVVLLALLGAASLGGLHAASPGHGKSIMAAYIVGTRGTMLHALILALSVTLAHTTGVLVLGILTVLASNLIVPDQLYPWLTLVSGGLVLGVGARFLWLAARSHGSHAHDHDHGHAHVHSHDHGSVPASGFAPTWRGLFALGLAGGIVPSGSALVVLFSSFALGRLGFGLVLIVAFGLGMALVLVATGFVLVHAGRLVVRLFPEDATSPRRQRLAAAVPILSAGLMTLLGALATLEGLAQVGVIHAWPA